MRHHVDAPITFFRIVEKKKYDATGTMSDRYKNLNHIYVDTKWQDNVPIGTTAALVLGVISSGPAKKIYGNSKKYVVFLFHDLGKPFHTLAAIKDYLKRIRDEFGRVGKVPIYMRRAKIEEILDANTIGAT